MMIDTRESGREFVNGVVTDPHLLLVAQTFGFEPQTDGTDGDKLLNLQEFTNATFDFRKSTKDNFVERWQSVEPTEINENVMMARLVFAASRNISGFNLVDDTLPSKEGYDSAWILGAGNKAPLSRLKFYTAHVGTVGTMFLLGSGRVLQDAEKEKTADYAPNANYEYDLMDGALRATHDVHEIEETRFGPTDSSSRDHGRLRIYKTDSGLDVVSIWAPAIEGTARANTADAYRFVSTLNRSSELEKRGIAGIGKSALSVTNAQYTFFQKADFMRHVGIPNGAETEIIGFGAGFANLVRKPHELLQEINSGINSVVELHRALTSR